MRLTRHLDSQDGALHLLLASSQLATASRLLPPRSGLERSDFVTWPEAAVHRDAAIRPQLEHNRHSADIVNVPAATSSRLA